MKTTKNNSVPIFIGKELGFKILNPKSLILICIFALGIGAACAQDSIQDQIQTLKDEIKSLKSEEQTHFMVRGFTQFGLEASDENINFNMTSFNPLLLWRQGDRFLFEGELEMEYMANQFRINLGYANASLIVSKGLVVRVGKFLIPFGTCVEKFHPSWINKFVTMPLGVGHDGIAPISDIGVEIRGGLQLGKSKMNYSLYAVNGPGIKDGMEEPDEAGMLSFENATDNNNNKAIGSRIGILPLSNSSLEIGFSGYYAMPGAEESPFMGDTLNEDLNYKDVTASLAAVDLSFVKVISPLKGILDIKGQYTLSNISDATYFNPEDTSRYTFTNNSMAYYAQLAYRPAMATNKVLQNLEVAGRYSVCNTPEGSLWHSKQSQIVLGLNYWIEWRTVIKINYQMTTIEREEMEEMPGMGSMTGTHSVADENMLFIHLAVGL
ncbi:MAG TPA: hypothetical protein VI757_14970 [Bacteroidia bacterium]|nr:hypothetical protein [Bacteroidia bacterium]